MFGQKISMIYWTAALLGKPMSYTRACEMADRFTIGELRIIYAMVKAGRSRHVHAKLLRVV